MMSALQKAREFNPELVLYEALRNVVKQGNPRSYLEIGTNIGGSLVAALTCEGSDIERICLCDTWGYTSGGHGRGNHKHIEEILRDLAYDGEVRFLDGDSKELVPKLIELDPAEIFDLVLVDGDHSFGRYTLDMQNAWPLLAYWGYMVVDDLAHPAHPYILNEFDTFAKSHECIVVLREVSKKSGVGILRKS
jgi:predicted O-methyltransferase YrrM